MPVRNTIAPTPPPAIAPPTRPAAWFTLAASLALALAMGGCSSDGTSDPAPGPSGTVIDPKFSNLQPILTRSCVFSSCHGSASPKNNLSLEGAKAYANIVDKDSTIAGRKLVAPGNPDASLLYQVLLAPVDTVERMPQASQSLPPEELAAFKQWIANGAKDD